MSRHETGMSWSFLYGNGLSKVELVATTQKDKMVSEFLVRYSLADFSAFLKQTLSLNDSQNTFQKNFRYSKMQK